VIDLYAERNRPEAIGQLVAAVKSDRVLPSVKESAVTALAASGNPAAIQPLRETAENTKLQTRLRESAVKAMLVLPGGDLELKRWSVSKDAVLAPAANSVLKGAQTP
jgi:HEAT repeat protein